MGKGFLFVSMVLLAATQARLWGDEGKELSPVERVEQMTQEIQKLQAKLRDAQAGGRMEEMKEEADQLRKAAAKQEAYLKELYDKVREADRAGHAEEAKRLGKEYEEAVRHGEYFRSMEEGRPKPAPVDVILTEVCFWPEEGKSEWVEMLNASAQPVDISGWLLVDGMTLRYEFPAKTPPVTPGGYVVVQFDGTGQGTTIDPKTKAMVLHTAAGMKGDLLGDYGGQIALYAGGMSPGISTIRSYVAWGRSPGSILADAIAAKRWKGMDEIAHDSFRPRSVMEMASGPHKSPEQGGTVDLVEGSSGTPTWDVFAATETSCGGPAPKRVPVPMLEEGSKVDYRTGKTTVGCVPMIEKGVRYHFQVCLDKECTKVFLDAPDRKQFSYPLEKPVPPLTTVYWRVRAIYEDGSAGAWSAPLTIINDNGRTPQGE